MTADSIICWSNSAKPTKVNSVELDSYGARLILPWDCKRGDFLKVSLGDALEQYATKEARIVWTKRLGQSQIVAGVAFSSEPWAAA